MLLPDLNVLIGAHRTDSPAHATCRDWLRSAYAGEEAFALCAPVLIGLVRVLTHPRVFDPPDTLDQAFAFVASLVGHPNAVVLNPGRDHLRLFEEACGAARARGDLVTDAYLAALATETGAVLVSADRDFARFPGLEWRQP
jgi:toxin-antitoxin system PIN domain toxin